jgi:tetratricopeptide (TPR) repeat protein
LLSCAAELALMADFFISYTSTDSYWAHWIGKELTALGHVPHVHEWEVEGGGDIYGWMEKRLDAADHVLCVISDEYLKAPYSSLERNAALWRAAGNKPGFVLFVAVKPARLPALSDHIRRCELFGVDEDTARARFREFLKKREAPETIAFPGQAFAVSNIPLHVPAHFMGRDDAFVAIEAALKRETSGPAVAALYGLRGVGKTTLAAAYAERHRSNYRATWWIRAQTEAGMRTDLVAFGVRLRWVGTDDKEGQALAVVMERLRQEGEGILLIFDNALDTSALKPYLPRGGGSKILVTSNTHAWRNIAAQVEIGLWPKNIGAEYLVARTDRAAERAAAEALSEALGGLPLAHEQAAAYCERLEKPLAEYRKRFEAAPARLLDDARDAPAEYHDRLTVTKTFALAIDEAAKLHAAVEPLIVHAALLAPEPLPLFLFVEGREMFGDPLATALADDGLDEALAALRAFALIARETIADERDPSMATETIRLHRLVRQVAADRCGSAAKETARGALIAALAAAYPRDISDAKTWPEAWPRARRLDAPALALLEAPPPEAAEEAASRLLEGLATYRHYALGAYAQARPLYERALALREKRLGPDHPDTAGTLNNLALLLWDKGSHEAARPLLERALAINEKTFGPEHGATATSLNNLALLLRDQGDLAAARSLFERALAVAEKTLGAAHPATAASLGNLALVLKGEGDLGGARALFERALAIDEKALGAEHPDTANNLRNLALLLKQLGELARARRLCERALAIEEKALGPEHPRTAATLCSLAELLREQGELAQARALFERALAVSEVALGSDHRDTAVVLGKLASLLHDLGDLPLARPHYQRALAINEKTLGPDHSAIATGLNNLAGLLQDQGDFAGARPLLERALAIDEKALGPGHPNTNRLRFNLARVLVSTGSPQDALKFGEAALAAHEAALGPSHPWTADSAGVMAQVLDAIGRTGEAVELRERYKLENPAPNRSTG